MDPLKNNGEKEDDRKGEDPFKEMFEEMVKEVNRMMGENMNGEPFNNPNMSKDITLSFSVGPQQRRQQQEDVHKEKKMLDVIDGENNVTVIMEIPDVEEESINTHLIGDKKLKVQAPKLMKEIPLSSPVKKIEQKNYSNGTLEVTLPKKD